MITDQLLYRAASRAEIVAEFPELRKLSIVRAGCCGQTADHRNLLAARAAISGLNDTRRARFYELLKRTVT